VFFVPHLQKIPQVQNKKDSANEARIFRVTYLVVLSLESSLLASLPESTEMFFFTFSGLSPLS
jgi:hypothetical protein